MRSRRFARWNAFSVSSVARWSVFAGSLLIALAASERTLAWDNRYGHDALTAALGGPLNSDDALNRYLADELGFGIDGAAFQLGLDTEIDSDARGGAGERFEFVLEGDRPAPPVPVVLNETPCARDSSFDSCLLSKQRSTALEWIRLGAFAEDNPNPRSQHHFHDPVFEHAGPSGNHGLDDDFGDRSFEWDNLLFDWSTSLLGRGADSTRSSFRYVLTAFGLGERDFDGKGLSALDRALNRPLGNTTPSDENPKNIYALPDAERYLFRAITSPYADEREHYASAHLIAIGHVLHFLQDMGSAGHTRNDFIIEHAFFSEITRPVRKGLSWLYNDAPNIDEAPREQENGAGDDVLGDINTSAPGASLPYEFLAGNPGPSFNLSDYSPTTGLPDLDTLVAHDVSELWDEGSPSSPSGIGYAEFTSRNFLSAGTTKGQYPLPAISSASCKQLGTPGQGVWAADLPTRGLVFGGRTLASDDTRFLSSQLVPHLAQCRSACQGLGRALVPDSLCIATPSDESVLRDYLEIEWAYAIRYGEALVRKLISPRIEVIPIGDNQFRLANLTPHEFRFDASAISIWYETADLQTGGTRRAEAPIDCGTGTLVLPAAPTIGEPGPASTFTCELPASLSLPARIHDDFFVAARGQWGTRGSLGTPAELDASGDYAVAFRRVLGQRVALHRDRPGSGTADESAILDVELVEFSIDRAREGTPQTRTTNLTASLRSQINAPAAADFSSPSAEPGGTRIAFGGDLTHDEGLQAVVPSEFYVVDLLDPIIFSPQLTLPSQLPVSGYLAGGPVWGSPFDEILYSGNATGTAAFPTKIVRHVVNSFQLDTPSANETDSVISAAKFGRAVGTGFSIGGSNTFDLFLMDTATGQRSHRLAFAPTLGTARAIPCPDPAAQACIVDAGDATGTGDSPAFAPGLDTRLAFVGRTPGEQFGRIYVVDSAHPDNAPITPLAGDATVSLYSGDDLGDLAWSTDGQWILFNSAEMGAKQVGSIWATLAPGSPVQIPAFEVIETGGRSLSVLPGLVLPAP